jgi:hypothetical protein
MYSFLELEFIFQKCLTFNEIYKAMNALLYIKADGDLTEDQVIFIHEISVKRVKQL